MAKTTQERLAQLQTLGTAVRVLQIDLGTAITDHEYHVAGTFLGGWLAPAITNEITVRFNDRSADAIPFRQGLALEVAFRRIYVTCDGTSAGTFYLVYGDASEVQIDVNAADVSSSTAAVVAELQDVEADVEAVVTELENSTIDPSGSGEAEVLSPGAATAANGSDQACSEAIVWTPDTDIHLKLGSTDADANDPLIPANTLFYLRISNTNLIRVYNNGPAAEDVNIIWRA
jgi:hypothetical protein